MGDRFRRSETPGADFIQVKPPKVCKKCGRETIDALVRHRDGETKWHTFDRLPTERDGKRFYSWHKHG